ncbi:MAG: hypothetical protein M1828_001292 [Chrysothrix sp. TS-e1954]|nr:MAG: hypothetical protein M1828_001292 [Chrysothrix sp. TS-e1954]
MSSAASDDEDYHSASDVDFVPDDGRAQAEDNSESSSEDEEGTRKAQSHKRKKAGDETAEAVGFDNSGDESTIRRSVKRRRKKGVDEEDEDGGEGGLIKTRAQRKAEAPEKRPLVETNKSNIDVDALWSKMKGSDATENAKETIPSGNGGIASQVTQDSAVDKTPLKGSSDAQSSSAHELSDTQAQPSSGTVLIKRKYEFAGQIMEEEKMMPADSAEAKLYLQEQAQALKAPDVAPKPALSRPMKRKSLFGSTDAKPPPPVGASKLNTLDKSKLDWAAQVDREGISQELDEASRSKGAYLNRLDFLGRMDVKRENDLRSPKP